MRWFLINCLLLTASASSEIRHKRDLNYLRNLFTSTFFGRRKIPSLDIKPERLFIVPSLENKLVTVVTEQNPRIEEYPMVLLNQKFIEAPQVTRVETLPRTVDARETFYVIPNESDTYDIEYKVKVPFEPQYSYKQLQNNEPVMTFTAHNNPNVIVNAEVKGRTALPMCIKQRIDDVVLIGANPYKVDPVIAMFPTQPHPSINIKYPEDMGNHMKTHLKLPELPWPRQNNMMFRPKVNEDISARLISLMNPDQTKVPTSPILNPVINMDQQIGVDKTVGPIPPPYILHKPATGENEDMTQDSVVFQPIFSRYMYKQLNHNSPNPTTVVRVGDQLDPSFTMNINSNTSMHRNYVFIPPKVNYPNLQNSNTVTTEKESNNAALGPKIIGKSKELDSIVKLNTSNSFQNNPIIVSDDKTFSYHKKNIDGSSISISGNNNGVSVDVENSTVINNRGDIPD